MLQAANPAIFRIGKLLMDCMSSREDLFQTNDVGPMRN